MRVNEIFYSLQGEGLYTGTPATFIRLSGCNLRCWFCDTDFTRYVEMSEEEVVENVKAFPTRHVVITGGEPALQLSARLTTLLHEAGMYIQMETNGTHALPEGAEVDWITCSPKNREPLAIQRVDELKVVYQGEGQDMSQYDNIAAKEYRLQPCDTQDAMKNKTILKAAIDYIQQHPKWKLSLQTHKIIDVR